ncbi:hypothetical protein BDZ91DRAFT_781368 [Kalaharituber pfeilii]|nr:hypothetical protein BDZ91DRAFT_781368 [Kalaharituber pfeilii]
MPQGNLTVYVPQLGASSPLTLAVPVGTSSNLSNYNKPDSESDINRFLAGLPSAEQNAGPNNFSINPSRGNWILFDVKRLSFIHRSSFNTYLENQSPGNLEGKIYVLLSSQASLRFTSDSLGTNFIDAIRSLFPQKLIYPSIDVWLKEQAQPPWGTSGPPNLFNVVLWIPGYALPWDLIKPDNLRLELAISNFISLLGTDTPNSLKPIVPLPSDNWVLINCGTQQIIPKAFVNNIELRYYYSARFILVPVTLTGLANQLLKVIKDGGVPAWEGYWKNYAAQGK